MSKTLLKFREPPKYLRIDVTTYQSLCKETSNHRLVVHHSTFGYVFFTFRSCEYIKDFSNYLYTTFGNNKLYIHRKIYEKYINFFESDSFALDRLNLSIYEFVETVRSAVTLELNNAIS